MTDITVTCLAEGAHNLQSLNLANCNLISDASLQALAKGCKQLVSVHNHDSLIEMCVKFDPDMLHDSDLTADGRVRGMYDTKIVKESDPHFSRHFVIR